MPLHRDNPITAARHRIARIVAAVAIVLCFGLAPTHAHASSGADIMVVFDESESMGDPEFDWLSSTIAQLDTELQGEGINDNRYGLMSFGMFAALYGDGTDPTVDHELYEPLGSIGNFTAAFNDIPTPGFGEDGLARGDVEDGYPALHDAAMLFDRGPEIARVIVFMTDEDRDEGDIDFDTIRQKLVEQDVILNAVLTVDLIPDDFEENDKQALALDSEGNAYVRGEGDTVDSVVPGDAFPVNEADNTVETYVDLVFAAAQATGLGGAVFDIRAIRLEEDVVDAFTRQFLDLKIQEIQGVAPAPEVPTPSSAAAVAVLLCYAAWRTRRRE